MKPWIPPQMSRVIRIHRHRESTLAPVKPLPIDQVPALFCLNGQPMYLQSEDTGISVYRVDGSAVSSVLDLTDYTHVRC